MGKACLPHGNQNREKGSEGEVPKSPSRMANLKNLNSLLYALPCKNSTTFQEHHKPETRLLTHTQRFACLCLQVLGLEVCVTTAWLDCFILWQTWQIRGTVPSRVTFSLLARDAVWPLWQRSFWHASPFILWSFQRSRAPGNSCVPKNVTNLILAKVRQQKMNSHLFVIVAS